MHRLADPVPRILSQQLTEGMWEAGDWGPLERFVTEEYISDTLWAFEPGYRRAAIIPAAEQLGTLPLPADHPERCQFLVAETLFGEMLALPRPPHEAIFYHIVVQDLCKAIASFPKMMANVVGHMFKQMGRMDPEARERLADWMAHHLSCFDLAWPWKSWIHVADQPANHPQRAFCSSVVRRLLRLSYHDRVRESLPEELHCLLPNKPSLNPDYLHETLNASSGALHDLQGFMKSKTSADKVMEWFNESGKLAALGRPMAAQALIVAALQHGQKCITHHNVLLKRYEPALRALTAPDEGSDDAEGCEHVLVAAAAGVWAGTHPHMAIIAVSRLLELGICKPTAVARWLATTIEDEEGAGTTESGASRGVAWGTADAWQIACLAVEMVMADRDALHWRWQSFDRKVKVAEAEATSAAAAAMAAAQRGMHADAQRAQAAEAAAVDRIEAMEKKAAEARTPVVDADALVADCAGNLALALVKALSPRLEAAAEAAAGPPPADAGKGAEPEPRDRLALAMCRAVLRRFRRQVGAAYEADVHEALGAAGVSPAVQMALREALSGRSTSSRANGMME